MTYRQPHPRNAAFTLAEVLVATAVLALLIALIAELFSNATKASDISSAHLKVDGTVRLLYRRMAADFSNMVKRSDVDYYLKSPSYVYWPPPYFASGTYTTTGNAQSGNDQMAFYSEVSGYSTSTDQQNAISLVAYRINTNASMSTTGTTLPVLERLATALSWDGSSTGMLPVVFEPVTIAQTWPTATSAAADPNYETLVPNAFRFEYYYLLHSGILSVTPWDTAAGHTTLNGLQDVAGIGIVLAVADSDASAITTPSALETLAGQMGDFPAGSATPTTIGELQTDWQGVVQSSALPLRVKNGIHIYEQVFSLDTPSQ